jgi:tRNA A-37 threonylcarbamoyl transferase component Bud32
MRRFSPLRIQIDAPQSVPVESRTTDEILRQKIGPSAILDHALSIAHEVNESKNDAENVEYITNVVKNNIPIVVHARRKFDTGEKSTPSYKSYVYSVNNEIVKVLNYNCNPLSDYVIIKEIAAQKYAETLSSLDKCDFETPSTTKIGRVIVPKELRSKYEFNCLFFITMTKITYKKLIDVVQHLNLNEDCNIIADEINRVVSCLEENNLYHNDLHGENILLKKENGNYRVGLIDYGNATEEQAIIESLYDCDKLMQMKRNVGSPSTITEYPKTPIGGKRRKRKMTKRKTNVKKKRNTKTRRWRK